MRALKNTAAVRQHNMEMLLGLIQSAGPISRAELSRVCGLSQPTVCGAVSGLIRSRLVRVLGEGNSTGGRRPVLLAFNHEAGYVVGVDLGGTTMKLGLTDLGGRLVHRLEEPTPAPEGSERDPGGDPGGGFGSVAVTEAIAVAVGRLVKDAGVKWEDVRGIGLGAPGVTDPETGQVTLAPAVGWNRATPVLRFLRERFGLPCRVDNDVNAAALAELAFGRGRELGDFVFVAIGTGIGAGIVIDGKLHRGKHNAAGEVGYLVIDHTWKPASVDGFGCFESMAAAPAIARRAAEAIPGLDAGGAAATTAQVEGLFELARQGNEAALQVVDLIAGYMGAALTNLTVVLDPQAVILGGGVSRAGDVLVAAIRRKMQEMSPILPEIYVSELGADAGMMGAAALAIEAVKERLLSQS